MIRYVQNLIAKFIACQDIIHYLKNIPLQIAVIHNLVMQLYVQCDSIVPEMFSPSRHF